MKGKQGAKSECVKVAVRVRPMNKREKEENSELCVSVDKENCTVSVTSSKHDTKTFQFDYVYPMDSTQREVYDQVAFPIVDSIFQGYNGTVFAYGQTGCGKTFTMMGVTNDPVLRGVIPNAFDHIFGYIKTEGNSKRFLLRCSFVEIYNEEVRDLLGNSNKKLEVREDPKKGTYVKDLNYISLKDTQDIEKALNKGNNNRHVGATSMNDKSSRSHSLFTVYLEIEEGEDKNKKIRSGKLNLVDLAGSERVSKTNASGQTFEEGKKINLSLTALGSVIDALSSNRKHIPYKDSKLTRLLADSLGGNTKTVMFANVSPASFNYDETVGTLRYASRAKLIKNAPKINEDPKDALLRQYEEEIKALKAQLENGGIPLSQGGNGEEITEVIYEEGSGNSEREKLLAKIRELEKNTVIGGPKIIKGGKSENNDLSENDLKIQEEERQKFKEYREQQLKNAQEMEEKYAKLEEEKLKEEQNLKNNVNALKQKVKDLKNEIEDLKFDNLKDKTDFLEEIKGINRDNLLYKGIIRFLLTENEVKKIIDLSSYNEESEKWSVHPFLIKEKKINLPSLSIPLVNNKRKNGGDMLKLNLGNHRKDYNNENDNNGSDENYDENDNDNFDDVKDFGMVSTNFNEIKTKIRPTNSKGRFKISNNPVKLTNYNNETDNLHLNDNDLINNNNLLMSNNNLNNNNILLFKKKEKEKFEAISNGNYSNIKMPNINGIRNPVLNQNKKFGKILLDPIGKQNI
jgi:kinesin family protein 3/17